MDYKLYDVFLVNLQKGKGGELYGKHYAVILTKLKSDDTLVIAPITSKKAGKKYRNGITLDCKNYQVNPSSEKAFIMVDKLREVSKFRIWGKPLYSLNEEDIARLHCSIIKTFNLK